MIQNDRQFVSRGGLKLQHALEQFNIDVSGKTALDVGSSTGGFVDCLLQNGAFKVYALDTAYGELAWKLRNDPRVVVMERTNILHLGSLPEHPSPQPYGSSTGASPSGEGVRVDLVTIDAGWTRLELVLKVVKNFLKKDGQVIALLKPHYEAEKQDLIKGVLDKTKAERVKGEVIEKILNSHALSSKAKFQILNCIESPILGGGGNIEYLLLLKPDSISDPVVSSSLLSPG